jgi:signal transduction histidine kinase
MSGVQRLMRLKGKTWPAGWLTILAVAMVVAVNAAGLWGIAVANRGAREEEARLFSAETAARARSLESVLSGTRAELAFLAGSPPITALGAVPAPGKRARNGEGEHLAAEGTLLVFQRGHPEVKRLMVKSGKDDVILESARRGGVPVLWRPQDREQETVVPGAPAIRGVFGFESTGVASGNVVRVVAEIDAVALLSAAIAPEGTTCALRDGSGRPLTGTLPATLSASGGGHGPVAEAHLRAEGWSGPSPWTLTCARQHEAASVVEPVTRRSRTLLGLNLAVMALAFLLGSFAIREARQRERLEAKAHEEARVRDLERQLFHAERLGTVGRLAAGMAHEINNPLEGIANYLALAKDHLARGGTEAVAQDLESVQRGLDRAAGILRRVLAHAEPESAPHGPVDLVASLRETLDFVRTRREFRSIAFVDELPAGPLTARGSSVMLGQVLLNLVINACEAQPGGGEVRVSGGPERGDIVVRVADRGPGVPESDRTRIFEPFYTTKQSTGLGLSVCHTIVAQHRGQLSVEGRAGGGATFVMRLPAITEEVVAHAV